MGLQWHSANIRHSLRNVLYFGKNTDSLRNAMNFHLRDWSADPISAGRENTPIHAGSMRSISLKYDFDDRGNTDLEYDYEERENATIHEWYNTFLVEHASSAIGSDFDFTRFPDAPSALLFYW